MYFNKNKLNRSHSENDLYIPQFDNLSVSSPNDVPGRLAYKSYSPVVRRVYVEEIVSCYENDFPNIMRKRFSEVIDDVSSLPLLSTIKQERDVIIPEVKQAMECEEVPMDVDSSFNEKYLNLMDKDNVNDPIVINDSDNEIQPRLKPRVTHINTIKNKENTNKWLFILIPTISFVLYCFLYNNTDIIVNTDIQVERIQTDLLDNVYGHKSLVESITHALETRSNWVDKLKVLSFVGSQGVGKTFVANLIKKHFSSNLVHEIYESQLYYETEKQKIINAINNCCLNLIIVDDLSLNDKVDLFALIDSLPKDSFILMITIFNIHYIDGDMNTVIKHEDIIKIRDSFDTSGIKNYELLVFEDLTLDHIKSWMKKQLQIKSITFSAEDEILQNVLDNHNINHGLKGLQSKLVLEVEKYRK